MLGLVISRGLSQSKPFPRVRGRPPTYFQVYSFNPSALTRDVAYLAGVRLEPQAKFDLPCFPDLAGSGSVRTESWRQHRRPRSAAEAEFRSVRRPAVLFGLSLSLWTHADPGHHWDRERLVESSTW